VMKLGMRRLLTSKTEPMRAQTVAVAGYVNSDVRNVIDRFLGS
jgi:hypothetical protein